MNVTMMILTALSASCPDPIYSIDDLLPCPIRYVDKQEGYFVSIDKNEFTIGTAIYNVKNPANDVPQISGPVENCSSRRFKCRAIGELVFAIPKSKEQSVEYPDGPALIIQRLANGGWHGSAKCSAITEKGCVWRAGAERPVEAYQYDVSPAGVVTSIKIQSWKDNGQPLGTQNMILVSKIGLKLN